MASSNYLGPSLNPLKMTQNLLKSTEAFFPCKKQSRLVEQLALLSRQEYLESLISKLEQTQPKSFTIEDLLFDQYSDPEEQKDDSMGILIWKLHDEETELDSDEQNVRRLKEKRLLKDKELSRRWEMQLKKNELLETGKNESFKDEFKMFPEMIQDDWREKVSKELVDEFHYICEERLRKEGNLDWILYSSWFSNTNKINKNMTTIPKSSPEWQ